MPKLSKPKVAVIAAAAAILLVHGGTTPARALSTEQILNGVSRTTNEMQTRAAHEPTVRGGATGASVGGSPSPAGQGGAQRAIFAMKSATAGDKPAATGDTATQEATTAKGGMDPQAFARYAGIPLVDGRLAFFDPYLSRPPGVDAKAAPAAWQTFVEMARLGARPDLLDNEEMAFGYARRALSEADQLRLAGGKDVFSSHDGWENLDEFDRRAVMERLKTEFAAKIKAKVPRTPVPAVEILPMALDAYDFDKGEFAIRILGLPQATPAQFLAKRLDDKGLDGMRVAVVHPLAGYPTSLKMAPAKAKLLLDHLKARGANADRRAYLAIFSSLAVSTLPRDHDIQITVTPERLALFGDTGLRELIHDYPLTDYLRQPDAPPPPEAREAAAIFAIKATPQDAFARQAEAHAASKGFWDAYLKSSRDYQNANEFERDAVLAQLRASAVAGDAEDKDLWLSGPIKLGAYDASRGGFAIEAMGLQAGASTLGAFDADIRHRVFNLADLAFLPVDRKAAEEAVKLVPDRKFEVRARVEVFGAAWDRQGSRPQATFEERVTELYVLTGNARSQESQRVLAHLQPGNFKSAQALLAGSGAEQPLPERPILSQDLLLTIATRDRLANLSPRALNWLLANRWLNDNLVATSLPAKFFGRAAPPPNMATAEGYTGPFRQWAATLQAQVPQKLTIAWERGDTGGAGERLRRQCHHMSTNVESRMFPAGMPMPDMHGLFQKQVNSPSEGTAEEPAVLNQVYLGFRHNSAIECAQHSVARELEEKFIGKFADWWPRVVVVLDRLPTPPVRTLGDLAEIDVALDKVSLVENGGDLPHVRLDVRFEEVRFLDIAAGSARASLLKAVKATDLDAAAAAVKASAGRDILGITLGQSFEEADRILKAHFTAPRVLDSTPAFSSNPPTFQNARIYLRQDGREFVALFHEPSGGEKTVLAVFRSLVAPKGDFDARDVIVSLGSKYGAAALNKSYGSTLDLYWGQNVARKSRAGDGAVIETNCNVEMGQNAPNGWAMGGQRVDYLSTFMPWDEVRDYDFMLWPRLDRPGDEKYAPCGEFLKVHHISGRMNGMSSFLVDIKAYNAAFAAARKREQDGLQSTVGAGQQPKLKL